VNVNAKERSAADPRGSCIFTTHEHIKTMDLLTFLADHGIRPVNVLQMAFSAMAAVLFLQSGLDKVMNWAGEKVWITGHFANSPLKGLVPFGLLVITFLEVGAGAFSAAGFFQILAGEGASLGLLGMVFGTKAIFLLFFGQRMAKDYAGAASLIGYFLMCAAGLYCFMAA
jgi:hypothetical protein